MRRILVLITDLEIGGTPTVVRELSTRLRRVGGVEVHVACLGGWGPVAEQIRGAGVGVTALGAESVGDVGVVARLIRLMREGAFDTVMSFLIHANAVAAAAALIQRGVRYIQSIQTTQAYPRWHWWVQGVVHEAAEAVVVPSRSVAVAAERWAGIPRQKMVVIPNAIEVGEFNGVLDGRKVGGGGFDGADSAVSIGFIGRLDPVKRVPDLLEAVKQLKGRVHLHVFGEGRDRERIEARIRELAIGEWVSLHGAIGRPQEALKRIELLVLPSEAEGFGLVLIEAMAAGVPVVATDAEGIRDVVRDGETGVLVPVGRPDRLAEAIGRVLSDDRLRHRLVEQARVDVGARFSWEKVLGQYRALLKVGEGAAVDPGEGSQS